jgi:signal transduction histidine kinase
LGAPSARLLGRTATELGLATALQGDPLRVMDLPFGGRVARWEVRRSTFRQGGRPHQLVMLTDLSKTLREEERQAWQRLVRVLSHEINNSLAPIKSIAGSLQTLLERNGDAHGSEDDLRKGLGVIANRSEALGRFMAAYARLAKLPRPRFAPVSVDAWVRRVAALETRCAVRVEPGPDVTVQADQDQLDQLLINLVSNAVDAAAETNGGVRVTWLNAGPQVEVRVEDEGVGLHETPNLFVPFFTTKTGGTGIGLVLSRQIAEAHGGTVTLENRKDRKGCIARVTLAVNGGAA